MIRSLVIFVFRSYQVLLSPFFGNCCRFHPSCSAYAIQAVEDHGCLRGLWLTAVRLSKCHPFHNGGIDPVPVAARAWPRGGHPREP
jgi:putative membrane protein insertion efficiency factor